MSFKQNIYEIIEKREIAPLTYDFNISCPDIASQAKEGQFIHIKCDGFTLRRPISICDFNKKEGTVRIVFAIRGQGTEWLAKQNVGDKLDIMGPLGNGFDILDKDKKVILIGGGIGVPPMVSISKHYGKNATAIIGFRNKELIILNKDFENYGSQAIITTDDGSFGIHGFVTDALKEQISKEKPDIIYACGPTPMLKGIGEIAIANGIRCQVSLEERMACGVGACLGCACKVKDENENETYKHVCKDGPVFEAREVVYGG